MKSAPQHLSTNKDHKAPTHMVIVSNTLSDFVRWGEMEVTVFMVQSSQFEGLVEVAYLEGGDALTKGFRDYGVCWCQAG